MAGSVVVQIMSVGSPAASRSVAAAVAAPAATVHQTTVRQGRVATTVASATRAVSES